MTRDRAHSFLGEVSIPVSGTIQALVQANGNMADHTVDTIYGVLRIPAENDTIADFLRRYGEWAALETRFIAGICGDGARVADIGAFLGTFGLGLARAKNLTHVLFVEPNSRIAPLLGSNVGSNCPAEHTVVHAAVAEASFVPSQQSSRSGNIGTYSLKSDGHEETNVIRSMTPSLDIVTLAELRRDFGPFDLIKIDVEGMEWDVLSSDWEWLASNKPDIWVECNEDLRSLDIAKRLLDAGFKLYYFAFNSFNKDNYRGAREGIFHYAYEAGLLARGAKDEIALDDVLMGSFSLLRSIESVDDLRLALWETPRWGLENWSDKSAPELAALAGRFIRGQTIDDFLVSSVLAPADPTEGLRLSLQRTENALAYAQQLAYERLDELEKRDRQLRSTQEALQIAENIVKEQAEMIRSLNADIAEVSARLTTN